MLQREHFLSKIKQLFEIFPIVAILGPRQCGKTTIARQYSTQLTQPPQNYFDLEDIEDLGRLEEPNLAFQYLTGLVTIDEIQLRQNLFPTLRVLVDKADNPLKFLILGSASRELLRQSAESLAGRIGYLELPPFSLLEVEYNKQLWLRGGYPLSYLAQSEEASVIWRKNYIKTFLEQDIPNLGINIAPDKLQRFWMMLSHYHGNIFNASELGRSLGLNHKTVQHYADILQSTFVIRQLQPWYENISKRQVKAPKIYIRDSGLLHVLLGLEGESQLLASPKLGASWEGYALEQVINVNELEVGEYYFWATHAHAELDLLLLKQGQRIGIEFKYSDAPKLSKSMAIAMEDLKLDRLYVIYPGQKQYLLKDHIHVISLEEYCAEVS